MLKRQLKIMKFSSSRLKAFGYNINLNFKQALKNKEIITLRDNQFLRSIRSIKNTEINIEELEEWFLERKKLRGGKSSKENSKLIETLSDKINDVLFIPEYISIVMDHDKHYEHLKGNGLVINFTSNNNKQILFTKKYIRLSCAAGHARDSTVIFCEETTSYILETRLNNGRNLEKPLVPSKFNAYFGLAESSTTVVTAPRICVVPDYKSEMNYDANFVIETDKSKDDLIEPRFIESRSDRFDGQGLVSVEMGQQWANDLGLDYLPAQWGNRHNFIKGMLQTFPIHRFCEEKNDGNYLIKTSFKDANGNNILVDLRNYDVVIPESQFKLWSSFSSMEEFNENCINNKLSFGITLPTPKHDSDILKMNYQFIQTLDLERSDIEDLCKQFVDWIHSISSDNIYHTLLFLLGEKNITEDKIKNFLQSGENHWVKSLVLNHDLIKDNYFKNKIYKLIKTKIRNACLGEIFLDGNYQTIVSCPYGMMQHICGHENVTGLLNDKEYYSAYWNNKGVKVVDSMRAPLTYRSEHLKLNLVNEEKHRDWYKYCTTGIIVNIFGNQTVHWAGSDFDKDILATTSNLTVLKGVYDDELPVTYEAPTAVPIKFTKEDLYNADLFAFGSAIGSITNKSTSGYALLPLFEEGSKEHSTIIDRLKMCTKLQSAQIDKAKIGREVKGIPTNWTQYSKIDKENDNDEVIKEKEFLNSILLDKHPYFFKYRYSDTRNKLTKYQSSYDISCKHKFRITLNELLNKKVKSDSEMEFLNKYKKHMPVIDTDCVMNNLCKYIESINFDIKNKMKVDNDPEIYKMYLSDDIAFNNMRYGNIVKAVKEFKKEIQEMGQMRIYDSNNKEDYDEDIAKNMSIQYEDFKSKMNKLCSNTRELTNYLVKLFYVDIPSSNKDLLWNTYGSTIYKNVKSKKTNNTMFPFPSDDGDINYLNKKYKLLEVKI